MGGCGLTKFEIAVQVFIINTGWVRGCRSRPSESHHDCSSPVAMQVGTGVFNGEYIIVTTTNIW